VRRILLLCGLCVLCAACGGNSAGPSTTPSGQTITYATLTVNIDGASCGGRTLGIPVSVTVDGINAGNTAPGAGVSKTVPIGQHFVSATGGVNGGPFSVQVPAAGFIFLITCN